MTSHEKEGSRRVAARDEKGGSASCASTLLFFFENAIPSSSICRHIAWRARRAGARHAWRCLPSAIYARRTCARLPAAQRACVLDGRPRLQPQRATA